MAIKLIAADMDGTLLTTDQRISKRNAEAIRMAIDSGIEFVFGTGRSDSECEMYYSQVKMKYSIYANGAYIMNPYTKEEYLRKTITLKEAKEIYRIYSEFDTVIFIQRDHWVYAKENFPDDCMRFPEYYSLHAPVELPYRYETDMLNLLNRGETDIEKFHVSFMTHDDAAAAYEILRMLPFKVVWCGEYCIEVTNKDADKGAALAWLGEKLGIRREEIMAIGDSDNDRSMIMTAGTGVAMGNASEGIKMIADCLVPSNNEDGVAFAIENYALK